MNRPADVLETWRGSEDREAALERHRRAFATAHAARSDEAYLAALVAADHDPTGAGADAIAEQLANPGPVLAPSERELLLEYRDKQRLAEIRRLEPTRTRNRPGPAPGSAEVTWSRVTAAIEDLWRETGDAPTRPVVAEHLGCSAERVRQVVAPEGGFKAAIEEVRGRL